MAKARAPVMAVSLREWARLTISEAVCGYARYRGQHECKRARIGEGACEEVEWQGLMAVIEGVLDEVETAAREVAAAGDAAGLRETAK